MAQRGAIDTQNKPGRAAITIDAASFTIETPLMVFADTDALPDGFATEVDEDGWLIVDTEAAEGFALRVLPNRVLAYG